LITIGYSRAKKLESSKAKFRSIYMLYAVGLVLILSRIPWGNWLGNWSFGHCLSVLDPARCWIFFLPSYL